MVYDIKKVEKSFQMKQENFLVLKFIKAYKVYSSS